MPRALAGTGKVEKTIKKTHGSMFYATIEEINTQVDGGQRVVMLNMLTGVEATKTLYFSKKPLKKPFLSGEGEG